MCRKGVEDVMEYQAEISVLPSPLCTFCAQKLHLEDAADVVPLTLCSFWHIATIRGCIIHYAEKAYVVEDVIKY